MQLLSHYTQLYTALYIETIDDAQAALDDRILILPSQLITK